MSQSFSGPDLPGPLVVGGVGGSGTRVVALILQHMGFYIGAYLNRADDNIWFDTMFNRPNWLRSADAGDVRQSIDLFDKAMHDVNLSLNPSAVWRIVTAALDKRHLTIVSSGEKSRARRWAGGTYHRVVSQLRLTRPVDRAKFRAWGWKHPLTHLYMDVLADFYPQMKFIMVIRHGLDMAFSDNSGQMRNWSWKYGTDAIPQTPAGTLAYWVTANRRAIETGQKRLGDRFMAVQFDALCQDPKTEVARMLDFIGLDIPKAVRDELVAIPRVPSSFGRHKQHDLGQFDPADVEAVRQLGFTVGG
jgi:hypothetical protein